MMLSSLRNDPVFANIFGERVSSSTSSCSSAVVSGAVVSGAVVSGAVESGAVESGAELTENMNGIPSIDRIQSIIEEAWRLGFDVQVREREGEREGEG